jgi:2-iminobutanoate/2-iminopropanoate deaminase
MESISPPETVGPYNSGIMAGEFLYISGQGAERPDGTIPDTLAGHPSVPENVNTVVRAAGLTLDHLVFTQVYLTESANENELNQVWREVFPKNPPARSTVGAAHRLDKPVEVSAVAGKDLSRKKRRSAWISGVLSHYSRCYGRRPPMSVWSPR